MLNGLKSAHGPAELLAIERVLTCRVPAELGGAECAPADAITRFIETAERPAQALHVPAAALEKQVAVGRVHARAVAVLRHVLRNSLIPIVTLLAGLLPGMIAGSVFIETIFTIPGMGFLAFQSVIVRDYPMAMALFTIGGALSLAGILVADILLKAVDPRIDFAGMQG